MSFADTYLDKQKHFSIKIGSEPKQELKFIVVIPCFNEPNLIATLDSLKQCNKIKSAIEVIIVINSSEESGKEILDQNLKTFKETEGWIQENENPSFRFFLLNETGLPKKFAGAGLARKIGMDQAIARFNTMEKSDGVIVSMDADSKVNADYFQELDKHFTRFPKTNAVTTYFEHPINGEEFTKEIYQAISVYELYLRYYKLALNYTGFPYSFYTVGSCFAVKAQTYIKQGGMNRKQAGEDFYFLHKVFPLGNCHEINSTCVYPSARISDRVPFGTGPMVKSIIESGNKEFLTYSLDSFLELKSFFLEIDNLYSIDSQSLKSLLLQLPNCISSFLQKSEIGTSIKEINGNSSNLNTFKKRFFNWFDAFKVLKYLNFAHEKVYKKQDLLNEADKLLEKFSERKPERKLYKDYLEKYRSLERQF